MADIVQTCMILEDAGEPLVLAERALPPPHPDGFILKTMFAGVCHSDLHFWDDDRTLSDGSISRLRDLPGFEFRGVTMGHEFGGTVHVLGKNVKDVRLGDKVVVYPWVGCRQCPLCRAGHSNMCSINRSTTTEFGQGGVAGCRNQGGYSTYVWVPESCLAVSVPDDVPMWRAVMIPCSSLTAYGALVSVKATVEFFHKIFGKASIVVIGCGGLGTWCLNLSHIVLPGKTNVIGVDVSDEKLEQALRSGADDVMKFSDEEPESVRRLQEKSDGGPAAVIDFVGLTRTAEVALKVLPKGGQLHCIGMYGGVIHVGFEEMTAHTHTITGSRVGSIHQLRDVINLVSDHKITGPPVEFYPLQEINLALNDLKEGKIMGRAIIKFD